MLTTDYANGILLLLATLTAILLANGPWSTAYDQLLDHELTIRLGPLEMTETIQEWINNTLMAIFFIT